MQKRPVAFEFFGGQVPSFSKALQWCNWDVHSFDWSDHGTNDLSSPSFQSAIMDEAPKVDCWFFDVPVSGAEAAGVNQFAGHSDSLYVVRKMLENCYVGIGSFKL